MSTFVYRGYPLAPGSGFSSQNPLSIGETVLPGSFGPMESVSLRKVWKSEQISRGSRTKPFRFVAAGAGKTILAYVLTPVAVVRINYLLSAA